MQLTKSFSLKEMQCPCGHCNGGNMDPVFMTKLQKTRDYANFPFVIDSAWRCSEHNRDVGGQLHSYHLLGKACDVGQLTDEQKRILFQCAVKSGFMGFGLGKNFMHIDDRRAPLYWYYDDEGKPFYVTGFQFMKMLT